MTWTNKIKGGIKDGMHCKFNGAGAVVEQVTPDEVLLVLDEDMVEQVITSEEDWHFLVTNLEERPAGQY